MPLLFSRTLAPDQTSRQVIAGDDTRIRLDKRRFPCPATKASAMTRRTCSRPGSRPSDPAKPLELAPLVRMLPPSQEPSSGNLDYKVLRAALETADYPVDQFKRKRLPAESRAPDGISIAPKGIPRGGSEEFRFSEVILRAVVLDVFEIPGTGLDVEP